MLILYVAALIERIATNSWMHIINNEKKEVEIKSNISFECVRNTRAEEREREREREREKVCVCVFYQHVAKPKNQKSFN